MGRRSAPDESSFVVQAFRTSTPRVIRVQLDLEHCLLRFWIDGRPLQDMSRSLPPGKAWMPTVHFKEKGLEVTLNPYGSSRSSFPPCLSQSTAPLKRALLAAELETLLVACNL